MQVRILVLKSWKRGQRVECASLLVWRTSLKTHHQQYHTVFDNLNPFLIHEEEKSETCCFSNNSNVWVENSPFILDLLRCWQRVNLFKGPESGILVKKPSGPHLFKINSHPLVTRMAWDCPRKRTGGKKFFHPHALTGFLRQWLLTVFFIASYRIDIDFVGKIDG